MTAKLRRPKTTNVTTTVKLTRDLIVRVLAFHCDENALMNRYDPPDWATTRDKTSTGVVDAIVRYGVRFFETNEWRAQFAAADAQAGRRVGAAVGKRFFPELF